MPRDELEDRPQPPPAEPTIKPCPFCGETPIFPEAKDVLGTFYEVECRCCGIAGISIQIIDCFDYDGSPSRGEVHNSWDDARLRYAEKFIAVARDEAAKLWNQRTND